MSLDARFSRIARTYRADVSPCETDAKALGLFTSDRTRARRWTSNRRSPARREFIARTRDLCRTHAAILVNERARISAKLTGIDPKVNARTHQTRRRPDKVALITATFVTFIYPTISSIQTYTFATRGSVGPRLASHSDTRSDRFKRDFPPPTFPCAFAPVRIRAKVNARWW